MISKYKLLKNTGFIQEYSFEQAHLFLFCCCWNSLIWSKLQFLRSQKIQCQSRDSKSRTRKEGNLLDIFCCSRVSISHLKTSQVLDMTDLLFHFEHDCETQLNSVKLRESCYNVLCQRKKSKVFCDASSLQGKKFPPSLPFSLSSSLPSFKKYSISLSFSL